MIVRHPYGYIARLLKSYGYRAVIIRINHGYFATMTTSQNKTEWQKMNRNGQFRDVTFRTKFDQKCRRSQCLAFRNYSSAQGGFYWSCPMARRDLANLIPFFVKPNGYGRLVDCLTTSYMPPPMNMRLILQSEPYSHWT